MPDHALVMSCLAYERRHFVYGVTVWSGRDFDEEGFFFHFLQLRDRVHIAHHDPGPQDPFPVRLMDDSMTRAAMSE